MNRIIYIICFLIPAILVAQGSMQEGFNYLENQQYDKAKAYFQNVLKSYPDNKTARICYGRAVGLGGKPAEGYQVFQMLEKDFPGDFEIGLNLAEALMWSKQYSDAREKYSQLLQKDSLSFPAVLGYANASAGLKEYDIALQFINRALALDPGYQNALISRKFILLGLADRKRRAWNFNEALRLLNLAAIDFPEDRDIIINKANVYLSSQKYVQAQQQYNELVQKRIDTLEGTLGLSYTSLVLNQKKAALNYAEKATSFLSDSGLDTALYQRTVMNYIFMLGINRKWTTAWSQYEMLENRFGDSEALTMSRARLHLLQREYDKAMNILIQEYPNYEDSFEYNMSMAEVNRAKKELDDSKEYIRKALELEPNQPDALRLLQELQLNDHPYLDLNTQYSSDNGNNNAYGLLVELDLGRHQKFRPFINASYRNTENDVLEEKAEIFRFEPGIRWQASSKLTFQALAGLKNSSIQQEEKSHSSIIGKLLAQYQLGKWQNIELTFGKDFQDYTAGLIQGQIELTDYMINYNLSSPMGLGVFTQLIHTQQSDGNQRQFLFASVFKELKAQPLVKTGLNFYTFRFDQSGNPEYFSPSSFYSGEVFFQFNNKIQKRNKIYLDGFLALGFQKIQENDFQNTRRIEIKLGYRVKNNLELAGRFSSSNSAQSTVSGFSFTEYGLQLKYILPASLELKSLK